MLKTFSLKNGVKVATYQLPSVKSVHLRTIVKSGAIVESADNNGVAHFMEHMLVQGIPSYPNVAAFSSYIESLAGNYGAHTSRYTVDFNITVPKTHVLDAITIGSEVTFAPLFVSEAIEKERQAVIAEITQKMDSHFYAMNEFSRKIRFRPGHPMLLSPGGDLAVVKKLTREALVHFWQQYFVPENTYVVLVGNFAEVNITALLENSFGKAVPSKTPTVYPVSTSHDYSDRTIVIRTDDQVKTCYITVSFPAIGFVQTAENALLREKQSLALTIFGELRNSRLFKLLRYQKGLVYDCGVGSALLPGTGYIQVYAEAIPENFMEVLRLLAKELRSFVLNGPTDEELAFAKHYLTNQWLMSFDHPGSIADWLEGELLEDDTIRMPEAYTEILAAISRKDVIAVMQQYWDLSRLNVIIQGPIAEDDEQLKAIKQIFSDNAPAV